MRKENYGMCNIFNEVSSKKLSIKLNLIILNKIIIFYNYIFSSQQERAKKRMEFENQCNRIYNQLDFEKQRDTESK